MERNGEFQISDWQETTSIERENGGKVTVAQVKQQYEGAITGHSDVSYVMHYDKHGDATFCGFEVITLNDINGQQLTLKHTGQFTGGKATSDFVVVHSDCDLQSKKGSFVSTENGKAVYRIEE